MIAGNSLQGVPLARDGKDHSVHVIMGEPAAAERIMTIDPRAGTLVETENVLDVSKLIQAFFDRKPDISVAAQRVKFGTSGHRGSAFDTTFNEDHILAITQAICRYRASQGIDGPLFLGRDTHALSRPRSRSRSRCWLQTA